MRKAPVFFLVLLLFSCSLFRPKVKPYPTGVVFPLEEAGQVAFEGKLNSALVKGEDGRLYFSTDKGHLYCLDGAAQQLSWHEANPSPFGCPPVLGPDRLFVWDQDNSVLCFDRQGKQVWKTMVPDKISSPISRDRQRIYVGTEAGDLLALSQATGELLWSFRTKGAVRAAAVFYRDSIILGSSDGSVYLLSPKGVRRGAIDLGSPISVTPLVDGGRLYVGAEDFGFHCYDLRTMKRKWKIKAGGRLLVSPSADQKRVYFQASNSVLYALDKSGGDILWWWIAPSWSSFVLGFDEEKILATSRSPLLFSLDGRSGKVVGNYEAKTEIRSNPVYAEPNLVFATFDIAADRGIMIFLRKEVKVKITPSLSSPQPAGTEVSFTASATGFYRPQYEFYLRRGEERSVVQKAAEKSSWTWFTDNEETYAVGVKVSDEKQAKEVEIPFEVSKKEKQILGDERPERSPRMKREEAIELLKKHLQNKNLVKHCLSVEACMKAMAARLGQDPEPWGLAGLLHDLDYELTEKSPELHTTETVKILEALGISPQVIHAVKAHAAKVPCESPMDWAIYSIDPLTGLIIAATLMHPTKKIRAIDLDFVKRRYKEKSFARGARREEIEECRNLGLDLDEFISICLAAMQGIDQELGL